MIKCRGMKAGTFKLIILLAACMLLAQEVRAQGTLYLSNLGQGAFGVGTGNGGWLAQGIETGTDSGGYVLNSVDLGMTTATGTPGGIEVAIYSALNGVPYQNLGTLNGSVNPSSAGVYEYDSSGIMLAPSTEYFVVAMDATTVSGGYYNWLANAEGASVTSLNDWSIQGNYGSGNSGSTWAGIRAYGLQTAIYATPVPEPSLWILGAIGTGILVCVRMRRA